MLSFVQDDEAAAAAQAENGRIDPVGRADSCMDHTLARSLE